MSSSKLKTRAVNELYLFAVLLFVGYIVLPVAIYFVGGQVFGEYEGGYRQFFGFLSKALLSGNLVTWFLVLSPYLTIQAARLTWFGYRRGRRVPANANL